MSNRHLKRLVTLKSKAMRSIHELYGQKYHTLEVCAQNYIFLINYFEIYKEGVERTLSKKLMNNILWGEEMLSASSEQVAGASRINYRLSTMDLVSENRVEKLSSLDKCVDALN